MINKVSEQQLDSPAMTDDWQSGCMSSRLIRARAGWEWLEMGSWNRISQHAMVPLLVPVGEEGGQRGGSVGVARLGGRGLTQAEPALVNVHAEGGDEAQPEVVAKRPGAGAGAQVPAHQGAVNGGVRQHRLGARVEVVDVDGAAVLLQVQTPEGRVAGEGAGPEGAAVAMAAVAMAAAASPGLERLHLGGLGRFVGLDGEHLDGATVGGHGQVMGALAERQRLHVAADAGVGEHRPGGGVRAGLREAAPRLRPPAGAGLREVTWWWWSFPPSSDCPRL